MADYEVKLDAAKVDRLLSNLADGVKNGGKILKSLVATIGFQDVIKHFKQKTGPHGSWKPRSRSTQQRYKNIQDGISDPPPGASRAQFDPNNELLVMTGSLRGGFTPTNVRMTRDSAALFNPVKYAGKHDRGEEGMPQRQFMWLSGSAMDRIESGFLFTLLKDAK